MKTNDRHDVIIIGGGAAGLSAGLVLARAQVDVLLIDSGEQRNAPAPHMHGFVSRDGLSPAEFLAAGGDELARYGASVRHADVTRIDRESDGTFVVSTDGSSEKARAILIATGLVDELPDLPGVRERWGTLVHHCPYCHGHEVLGRNIAVVGGVIREMSIKQAALLRSYSDRVSFITNGIELSETERHRLASFGVQVVDETVSHLTGDDGGLDGIALTDGEVVDCDAVFIAPRQRPRDGLPRTLGCDVDDTSGLIRTDGFGHTSVPGIWAAGNVVTPTAQVITAAGAGSAAAIAINGWLLQLNLDAAAAA
ncbi:NAD(P)/FAD-dependent oxidoreductase [Microbacterium sp. LWH12-1.2]|uniref:NAD(P)/FAD-dependent oxidoreductase n=1 Tax=Microbacterium sp. LWH12-1.2 TaxID=3135259 RepID=UPI0032528484